jgi:gamma-glutamyl:cysteine ligase YbdK (ATP-grasp superfamily)
VARRAVRARGARHGPRLWQAEPRVRRTLAEIEPHARELGSERELEGVAAILGRGSSADRQLRIYNANRDIVEVAREIAEATEALPAAV